jgi:queuine tRNA-ribosyltransferase
MTGATIASIHNLRFLVELTEKAREALLAGTFFEFKENFVKRYYKNK